MSSTVTLVLTDITNPVTDVRLTDALRSLSPHFHTFRDMKPQCWTARFFGSIERPSKIEISVLTGNTALPDLEPGVAAVHMHLQYDSFCRSIERIIFS